MTEQSEGGAEPVRRRDFLYIATGAVAGVGTLLAAWPFLDQMEPSSGVLAAGSPITVDLSTVAPGQQVELQWRKMPIFIVHRTPAILAKLKSAGLIDRLRDPNSQELQQPDYAANWCRSIRPDFLVLVGICTHLGCIPTFMPAPGSVDPSWPGGWLCHCHGSRYDLAGRVFKGVPAPYNLPVLPYHFASATQLVIGENPPGQSFELSSVRQL